MANAFRVVWTEMRDRYWSLADVARSGRTRPATGALRTCARMSAGRPMTRMIHFGPWLHSRRFFPGPYDPHDPRAGFQRTIVGRTGQVEHCFDPRYASSLSVASAGSTECLKLRG